MKNLLLVLLGWFLARAAVEDWIDNFFPGTEKIRVIIGIALIIIFGYKSIKNELRGIF